MSPRRLKHHQLSHIPPRPPASFVGPPATPLPTPQPARPTHIPPPHPTKRPHRASSARLMQTLKPQMARVCWWRSRIRERPLWGTSPTTLLPPPASIIHEPARGTPELESPKDSSRLEPNDQLGLSPLGSRLPRTRRIRARSARSQHYHRLHSLDTMRYLTNGIALGPAIGSFHLAYSQLPAKSSSLSLFRT